MTLKEGTKAAAISMVTTFVAMYIMFLITINDSDAKGYKEEIKKELSLKATIEYVDKGDKAVRDEYRIDREWLMKTIDRIDKRTEKMEDKLNR